MDDTIRFGKYAGYEVKAAEGIITALAESLVREGRKTVTAGSKPMALKRGIDKAAKAMIAEITKLSKPTRGRKEIAQVATISSNNDKPTGDLFADAMEKVGKDGVITVEEAKGVEATLDVVEGMQFDRGSLIGHSRAFPGLPGTFSASC